MTGGGGGGEQDSEASDEGSTPQRNPTVEEFDDLAENGGTVPQPDPASPSPDPAPPPEPEPAPKTNPNPPEQPGGSQAQNPTPNTNTNTPDVPADPGPGVDLGGVETRRPEPNQQEIKEATSRDLVQERAENIATGAGVAATPGTVAPPEDIRVEDGQPVGLTDAAISERVAAQSGLDRENVVVADGEVFGRATATNVLDDQTVSDVSILDIERQDGGFRLTEQARQAEQRATSFEAPELPDFVDEPGTGDVNTRGQTTVSPTVDQSTGDSLDELAGTVDQFESRVSDTAVGQAIGDIGERSFELADETTDTIGSATDPVTDPIVSASEGATEFFVDDSLEPTTDAIRDFADDRAGEDVIDTTATGLEALGETFVRSTVGLPAETARAIDAADTGTGFVASELQDEGAISGTVSSANTAGDVGLTASRAGAQAFRENPARTTATLGGALAGGALVGTGASQGIRSTTRAARNADTPNFTLSPRQQDVFETVRPRPGGDTQASEPGQTVLDGELRPTSETIEEARQQDARPTAPGSVDESAGGVLDALDDQRAPSDIARSPESEPRSTLVDAPQNETPPLRQEIADAGGVRAFLRDEDLPGQQIRPEEMTGRVGEFLSDESGQATLVGRGRQRSGESDTQPEMFEEFANRRQREQQQRSRDLQSDLDTQRPAQGQTAGDSSAFPGGRVDQAQRQEVLVTDDGPTGGILAGPAFAEVGGTNSFVTNAPESVQEPTVGFGADSVPVTDTDVTTALAEDIRQDLQFDTDTTTGPDVDQDQEPDVVVTPEPVPEPEDPDLVVPPVATPDDGPQPTPTPEETPPPPPTQSPPRDPDETVPPRRTPRVPLFDDDEEEEQSPFVETTEAADVWESPITDADEIDFFGRER